MPRWVEAGAQVAAQFGVVSFPVVDSTCLLDVCYVVYAVSLTDPEKVWQTQNRINNSYNPQKLTLIKCYIYEVEQKSYSQNHLSYEK